MGMSTRQDSGRETIDWFVEVDDTGTHEPVRKPLRVRQDDQRANSLGMIIITSMLFVLFAAALMVGGHAAFVPLLRSAIGVQGTNGSGEALYTMPDGTFCRHMSIDNVTGQVIEGAIERCPGRIGDVRPGPASRFEWGSH
jgi:hypothetical protein